MNPTINHVSNILMEVSLPPKVAAVARQRASALKCPDLGEYDKYPFLRVDPNFDPGVWEAESEQCLREFISPWADELCTACRTACNALHIKGLPTEGMPPPAPYKGLSRFSDIPVTLVSVFAITRLIDARPFAYYNENGGRILRDVVAREDARSELSSQGWGSELPWHMDGAYRPLNEVGLLSATGLSPAPHWLIFGVIYDSPRIPMTFVSLDEALNRLSQSDIEALSQPIFSIYSPDSFHEHRLTTHVPILVPDGGGGYWSRYNQEKCLGNTPAAQRSLRALSSVLQQEDLQYHIELSAGDVVVLDNWRSLHMRRAYSPRWDGTDRWLVRLYAATNFSDGIPFDTEAPHVWR
jgi:L-asparagine oxygenase